MHNKSKEIMHTYKPLKNNINISKNITYNKPLFINMKSEKNIKINTYNLNQKSNSISTNKCSANSESAFNRNLGNNSNRIYSVKDFEINNCSKTSLHFFSKYINTSISSTEDLNNNYETLTPSRIKIFPFIEEDEKQFTPYLGQKESKKKSSNKNNDKEKNNYCPIFNNSRKEIESTSLNLRNHFDEQLSNNYKIINKFQKLSFYQKEKVLNNKRKSLNENNTINKNTIYSSFVKLNKNSKAKNKLFLYKKKVDLSFHRENERKILEWFFIHNIDISERDIYEKNAVLIQTVFRGYISRIKLYNKLKVFTCISLFNETLNNIYFRKHKSFLKFFFQKLKKIYKEKVDFYTIEECQNKNKILNNEIKELIEQNNELHIKLNEFLINNNILKNDVNNYKEFELKYNNLLIQLEKLKNANKNILRENKKLMNELNNIKNMNIIKSGQIEPQKIINVIIESINNKKIFKNIEIQNINNMLIEDTFKSNNNNKNIQICSKENNLTLLNNNKILSILKNIKICYKINNIEIKNQRNIGNLRELTTCFENNLSFEPDFKHYHTFSKTEIEKQNNFYLSQIQDYKKFNTIKFIVENKNFMINGSSIKLNKSILVKEKINDFKIQVGNKNEEIRAISKRNENILYSNKSQIKEGENNSSKDITAYDSKYHPYNEQNIQNPEKLINLRNSLRISLRNKKIELEEVKVEIEETNLSKEEILKRKRLRDLFKNKLFLLRDITRKYFLRFYYNGIYLKMGLKKPKPIGNNINRIKSEDIIKKRRNTSFIEKGQYLRKIISQKAKEKKEILKKHFNLLRKGLDIHKIIKKLIEYKKTINDETVNKRGQLLLSIINRGNFNLLSTKRCLIIWKYKIFKEKNKISDENDSIYNYKKEIKDFDEESDNSESGKDEDSIDYYIKHTLKRNFSYDNDENI